jgi:hypothetical protein
MDLLSTQFHVLTKAHTLVTNTPNEIQHISAARLFLRNLLSPLPLHPLKEIIILIFIIIGYFCLLMNFVFGTLFCLFLCLVQDSNVYDKVLLEHSHAHLNIWSMAAFML